MYFLINYQKHVLLTENNPEKQNREIENQYKATAF